MCKINKRLWEVWLGKITEKLKKSEKEFLIKVHDLPCPEIFLTRNEIKIIKLLNPNTGINLQDLEYKTSVAYPRIMQSIKWMENEELVTSKLTKQRRRVCYLTERGGKLRRKWLDAYRRIQDLEK